MYALYFKWVSVFTLSSTAVAFYFGWLPPYHVFTPHDRWVWIIWLGLLSLIQAGLLICKIHKCYVCRVWSDFVLQFSGLIFIILSCIFSVKYPPLTWAMGIFPLLGIIYLIIGRIFSLRSRQHVSKLYGYTNPY